MKDLKKIKNIFLKLFIFSLILSGILASISILTDSLDENNEFVLTSLLLAFIGIQGITYSSLINSKFRPFILIFSINGIINFFWALYFIWVDFDSGEYHKIFTFTLLFSFVFASNAGILILNPKNICARYSRISYLVFLYYFSIALYINWVVLDYDERISNIYFNRSLDVSFVLALISSLLILVFNRLNTDSPEISISNKPVFLTGNKNKIDDARKILGEVFDVKELDLDEIQSLDLKEIISHKLKQAAEITKSPCFVMDTSLEIDALNGFPGPFIKWFFEKSVGAEKTCEIVKLFNKDTCKWTTLLGYFDGKDMHYFSKSVNGRISPVPKGENGYHWDVIFIPEGETRTLAEMSFEEKQSFAVTKKLLEEFKNLLIKTEK